VVACSFRPLPMCPRILGEMKAQVRTWNFSDLFHMERADYPILELIPTRFEGVSNSAASDKDLNRRSQTAREAVSASGTSAQGDTAGPQAPQHRRTASHGKSQLANSMGGKVMIPTWVSEWTKTG
jgi:hypothetical protein